MKVKNEMETAVKSELGRQAGEEKPASMNALWLAIRKLLLRSGTSALRCRCAWCRNDIMALSLTKLPPCYCLSFHYGVSHRKIEEAVLRDIVSHSIRRIGGRPRHSWSASYLAITLEGLQQSVFRRRRILRSAQSR